MYRGYKISVYIPCRNESDNLHLLRSQIPRFVDESIVVSNKSTDTTIEVAKRLNFRTIVDDRVSSSNIGYGYAHMTGMAQAMGDIIISIDGDGQHPVNNLPKILDYFIDNKLDFLSCNRFPPYKKAYRSTIQWIGIKTLNIMALILFQIRIKDILSGMWVINKSTKASLSLNSGDWNLSPEIKLKAFLNPNIKSGEFNVFQYARKNGHSHQKYMKTGISHVAWMLNFKLENIKKLLTKVNPNAKTK